MSPPELRVNTVHTKPGHRHGEGDRGHDDYAVRVIVLDTNQLEAAQPPNGPTFTLLRAIATETGHELAVPEMALHEHMAHVRHQIESAYADLARARRTLHLLVPSWPGQVSDLDVQLAVARRDELMRQLLRPLPAPDGAAANGLDRELERIPPAKTSWEAPGSGGRDVVIWLTALEACRMSEGTTYFVSKDKDAFGGATLHPFLAAEVASVLGPQEAERFRYCYGIVALLGELAHKHERPPARENVAAAEPVREAVSEALSTPEVSLELGYATGMAGQIFSSPLLTGLTLREVQQAAAYKVGETVWATARATWRAQKQLSTTSLLRPAGPGVRVEVAFEVSTTLLMQLDSENRITAAVVSSRGRCSYIESRRADSE